MANAMHWFSDLWKAASRRLCRWLCIGFGDGNYEAKELLQNGDVAVVVWADREAVWWHQGRRWVLDGAVVVWASIVQQFSMVAASGASGVAIKGDDSKGDGQEVWFSAALFHRSFFRRPCCGALVKVQRGLIAFNGLNCFYSLYWELLGVVGACIFYFGSCFFGLGPLVRVGILPTWRGFLSYKIER